MKFKKTDEKREWYVHCHPFTFWIWEEKGQFDIAWHYGVSSGSQNGLSSLDIAKLWCSEFALKKTLEQLESIAPEGGRAAIIDYQYKFVCDGAIYDMGYYCCLDIGHSGQCYTATKNTNFTREN